MASSSNKSGGKGKNPAGQKYSSTNYRITEKAEHHLRHAALYLEIKKDPINKPQQMVEDAVAKYIEYLVKRKGVSFPDYLTEDDPKPSPDSDK